MLDSESSVWSRLKRFLIGQPKNLADRGIFHHLSLIPVLAWVGLGADGLSSSAYGPEEAFKALGEHTYMAILLALLTAATVFIISAAYRRIIEEFPHGGGGYVVASKLLGRRYGVISGSALLVDYVLTITISIAAAGDALFSFLPPSLVGAKLTLEIGLILLLMVLNFRGVRESVMILTPIFMIFLVTHAVAIGGGLLAHVPQLPATAHAVSSGFHSGYQTLGLGAMILLFIHAYSLGGGTYTGIEAVSNGLPIMREPKVQTAKRTMTYMAVSLALTAAGLLVCYLLWGVHPVEGKTMNAVFLEKISSGLPFGSAFVIISLLSEGLLLVVAAQAGFIDGPRVLANMAVDSWLPRRFAALSERLTTGNGILFMAVSALAALIYTGGEVSRLVVMYSINVFLTFSLSIFGMLRAHWRAPKSKPKRKSGIVLFAVGFAMCAVILAITIFEKFTEGGWVTLTITAALVLLCFAIKSHYLEVAKKLRALETSTDDLPRAPAPAGMDPADRTAVLLVGGYGGLGVHTLKSVIKTFPGIFKNFIFVSVGVVDSGGFKGEEAVQDLKAATVKMLDRYVHLAHELGLAAAQRCSIGTDIVHEGRELCEQIAAEFPKSTFFTGKVIFSDERWYQRLLHNETGFALQKRLQLAGLTMVVLPAKVIGS